MLLILPITEESMGSTMGSAMAGFGLVSVLYGWLIFAIANGAIAASRGRNPLVWFLLTLPLGVVATLLVVALPPVPPLFWFGRPRQKPCPDCAEYVKVEAAKCRFCGRAFDMTPS